MSYRDEMLTSAQLMGIAINRREALLMTPEKSGLKNEQISQDMTVYSVKQVLKLFAEIESESKRMDNLKNKWKTDVQGNERGK